MKMRVGHTQAVTKDITSRRDQRLAKVMLDMRRAAWPWERRSDKRSGVTLIVISTVLKRTPRKTMDIDGGLSLCGDDWTPRSRSKLSRAANASADLVGSSVPPKSSLKFCTGRTERAEHEVDSRHGAHCGRAETEKGGAMSK